MQAKTNSVLQEIFRVVKVCNAHAAITYNIQDPALKGDTGEVTDIAVRVRFNEDSGFEPPQGSLDVIEVSAYKCLSSHCVLRYTRPTVR